MPEGVESETYLQWLSQEAPHVQLHHLMSGYRISAAIHVAAELNLADLLAAGRRPARRWRSRRRPIRRQWGSRRYHRH